MGMSGMSLIGRGRLFIDIWSREFTIRIGEAIFQIDILAWILLGNKVVGLRPTLLVNNKSRMMKSYSDFRCVILILFFISLNPFQPAFGQIGTALQPVSGADGVYETVMMDGKTVYRSVEKNGQFELYMYFRCSRIIKNRTA